MTLAINEVLPRVHYVATALQTHFVVPFEFMDSAYIKVYVNGVLKTYADPPLNVNQYSTTGAGVTGGGAIDFGGLGLALNDEVVIYGDIPIERLSDYPTSGKFPITALNEELDKMTSMLLEARMQINRSLRLSDQDFETTLDPIGEDRADKVLGFDADGQPHLYTVDDLWGTIDEAVAAAEAAAAAAQSSEDDAETAQAGAQAAYNATVAAIAALGAVLSYKGAWDASVGTFPGGGAAYAGWQYSVSVAGTVNGVVFTVGDRITALVNNASTTVYAANWLKSEDSEFGIEISASTTKDAVADTDLFGFSDQAAGGLGKKTAWSNLKSLIWTAIGPAINALTAKSSLVDNDLVLIADSAASNASKKSSFANIYTWMQVKLNTTSKATPVAADRAYIGDSAASNAQKYTTLTALMTLFWTSSALTGTPTAPTAAAMTNTTQIATTAFVTAAGREKLTATRNYYVRTDGSDSNTGLVNNAGGAFLTINRALAVILGMLDLAGQNVNINIIAGTYATPISMTSPQVGAGDITLIGDTTTPSNINIATGASTCLTLDGRGVKLFIQGLKLSGSGFACAHVKNGAYLKTTGKNEWGSAGGHRMQAESGGAIDAFAAETVSGTVAGSHYSAGIGGVINCSGAVWTASGTATQGQFAGAGTCGVIFAFSNSSSGTFVGLRYNASLNGVITTNGGGASYFPGSIAGTTATGGQYA